MKIVVKAPKARNTVAVAVRFKRGGAHGKSRKAERRAEKVAFKKEFA